MVSVHMRPLDRRPKASIARASEGAGLLQVVVRCGPCGRETQVSYSGASGAFGATPCHTGTEHAYQAASRALEGPWELHLNQLGKHGSGCRPLFEYPTAAQP